VRPTQSVCACVNRIEDDERVVPRREEEEEGGREGKRGVTNKKKVGSKSETRSCVCVL